MSGGYWNYKNDYLANEIFGWMSVNYGEKGFSQSKIAAKKNPLEDKEISEMVWDIFCILHSYDWYVSGDINETYYLADIEYFKKKWLKTSKKDRIKRQIDNTFEDMKEEFYRMFGVQEDGKTEG